MVVLDATADMQSRFWQACEHLLMYHTNPWELDEALTAAGYAMGPCESQDLIGLDRVLGWAPNRPLPILKRMVAEGRMGKIAGVGYYRYPGGGGAVIDPLIEDLILEEAWFSKVTRSAKTDAELVAQLDRFVHRAADDLARNGLDGAEIKRCLAVALHYPLGRLPL